MENILCVIDPTSSLQPALRRAVWFAKRTRSHLELVIFDYNGFLSGHRYFDSYSLQRARAQYLERHSEYLSELAENYRESGLEISTDTVWDRPLHESIVRHACSTGADIVFKDTHQHGGFSLASLSNTDWNLIRTCPMPLWLVKPFDFPQQPKLIAAIDPMHEHDRPAALDNEILRISQSIADFVDGDVHAFHAYDTTMTSLPLAPEIYLPSSVPTLDLEENIRKQHQERFERIAADHGIGSDRSHLVSGRTHQLLPQLASQINASLVVIGAVARSRLKRIFIGSTAESTLDRLVCDLLVVKPDKFKTPVPLEIENAA